MKMKRFSNKSDFVLDLISFVLQFHIQDLKENLIKILQQDPVHSRDLTFYSLDQVFFIFILYKAQYNKYYIVYRLTV